MRNLFRYFNSSPEIIRLTVMMYIRYPLSLRQVEDSAVRTRHRHLSRDGPVLVELGSARCSPPEIRKHGLHHQSYSNWRWHLDEVFVRINGETHYLWRAVDHEGEVLDVFATKRRDRRAALQFLKRAMKRYGQPKVIVTDRLRVISGSDECNRECRRPGVRPVA